MDDLEINLSIVNGNLAHTCGNATSIVFEHFKSTFPKKYFKYEHINTRLAIRQYQDIRKTVDFKRPKPILAMQPKLIPDDTEFTIEFQHRMYGTSLYDLVRKPYTDVKFFKDPNTGIIMDFNVERAHMTFEFTVIVSTEYQQYNTMNYMRNTFNFGHPLILEEQTLETPIPDCVIQKLSQDACIPVIDENGSVEPFLSYINKYSNVPIMYGFESESGIHRFFMVLKTNMNMVYENLSMNDANMDGQTSDNYQIQCQLDLEFNFPSTIYYLLTKGEDLGNVENIEDTDLLVMKDVIPLHFSLGHIIPDFDDDRNPIYETCTIDNYTVGEEDRTPIGSIFTQLHKDIVQQMLQEHRNPSRFIHFVLYQNSDKMKENEDYFVDWETMELVLKNPEEQKTYRIAIYINNSIQNEYIIRNHKY